MISSSKRTEAALVALGETEAASEAVEPQATQEEAHKERLKLLALTRKLASSSAIAQSKASANKPKASDPRAIRKWKQTDKNSGCVCRSADCSSSSDKERANSNKR